MSLSRRIMMENEKEENCSEKKCTRNRIKALHNNELQKLVLIREIYSNLSLVLHININRKM